MSVSKKQLEKINEMIVNALKDNQKPWRKTWSNITFDGESINSPINMISKNEYKGFNRYILGLHRSEIPVFLTFQQVKNLGCSVNKGAISLPIIYFSKVKTPIENITDEESETQSQQKFILKHYNVFNITDTNIKIDDYFQINTDIYNHQPIESVETIINQYLNTEKIKVHPHLSECFYAPISDTINMVEYNRFETPEDFYSTFLHEIVHSTGHTSRLNRLSGNTKRKDYAFEELIAETAACYLTDHIGISNDTLLDNSTAYLQSWIAALDNDPYFFYAAAKNAEQAANYILQN